MPSRPIATIAVPHSRMAQLQTLAKRAGVSLSGLMDQLVNQAIEAGELPDTTPGTLLWANDWGLACIQLGDLPAIAVSANSARTIAAEIGSHIEPPSKVRTVKLANDGSVLAIERLGKGILIRHIDANHVVKQYTCTPGVARDLVRQISKAADHAEEVSAALAK